MVFRRIVLVLSIVAVVIAGTVAATYDSREALETAAKPVNRPTVIIDAGHGGLTNTIKV